MLTHLNCIDESIVSAATDVQTPVNSPTAAHNSSTQSMTSGFDASDNQWLDPPNTAVSGKHNLIVLYYNARSLSPKTDHFIANCEIHKPDIICITESWLSSDILNCEIAMPIYNIVR